MKKLNWKQWTAIGITVAVVVTGVVLHFVQPNVTYAFAEAMTAAGFVVGGVVGYLLKDKNIVKTDDKK
jgi:hypothetical protein